MAMLLQLFVGMDVDGLVLTVDMGMGMGVAMGVGMDETAVGVDMGVDVGVFVGVLQGYRVPDQEYGSKDHDEKAKEKG